MKLAIMQPYFLPYIGYFQLMNAADEFVVYDNIKFTKKGWINRNRILVQHKDEFISLPLKKDSDYLNVCDRQLADDWEKYRLKIIRQLISSYKKSPFYKSVFPVIEDIFFFEDTNLFNFIYNAILKLNQYLNIKTPLIISSTIPLNTKLKGEEKVIEICKLKSASEYINSMGGVQLYKASNFSNENILLRFLKTDDITYKQFENEFIPSLSIVDVMMFNPIEKITEYLNYYTICNAS